MWTVSLMFPEGGAQVQICGLSLALRFADLCACSLAIFQSFLLLPPLGAHSWPQDKEVCMGGTQSARGVWAVGVVDKWGVTVSSLAEFWWNGTLSPSLSSNSYVCHSPYLFLSPSPVARDSVFCGAIDKGTSLAASCTDEARSSHTRPCGTNNGEGRCLLALRCDVLGRSWHG